MTLNKPQRLLPRQYRELHEATSPKRVIFIRLLKVFLGSMLMAAAMAVLLYLAAGTALVLFVPFAAGLILGNTSTHLGALMRQVASWSVVEEITDWAKVYELSEKNPPGQ